MSRRRTILGVAIGAAAAGVAGGAAVLRVAVRHHRSRPDVASGEEFTEPPGCRHRSVATSDGGLIDVVERGNGRPFVLLHGVTLSTLSWHYQLSDLVDAGYRVVALDARGHGLSTAGHDGYPMARMAEDVHEVLRVLEVGDAILVGHSLGGMTALQLLFDHPELASDGTIAGIVLASTSASPVIGNGVPAVFARVARLITPVAGRGHAFFSTRRPHARGGDAVLAGSGTATDGTEPVDTGTADAGTATDGTTLVDTGPVDAGTATDGDGGTSIPTIDMAGLYCRLAFGTAPSATHIELVRAMTSAVPPDVVSPLIVTLAGMDVRRLLADVRAPTLVVVGQRDLLTPVWHSRYLASHIPGAELIVLPGAGHMLQFERRAELADLLVDWAERWPGRRWVDPAECLDPAGVPAAVGPD